MAEQLMKTMSSSWKPEEFTDTFRQDLLKLLKQRAKSGKAKASPEVEEREDTKVLDLMAALKRSVAARGKAGTRTTRTPSRPRGGARKSA